MQIRRGTHLSRIAPNKARFETLELRRLLALLVNTTADSGFGSLRQAILDANATAGADAITFAIGSGLQSIALASALPSITDPLVIDGTTQPGYSGLPLIEINGQNADSDATGLVVTAGSSTLR